MPALTTTEHGEVLRALPAHRLSAAVLATERGAFIPMSPA